MLSRKVRDALEEAEYEMNLNLENNYKELAYENFLDYVKILKKFKDQGLIKEKDLVKLEKKVSDYKEWFVEDENFERGKKE